jgi:Cd2+/Zn2+-exporting ATPase
LTLVVVLLTLNRNIPMTDGHDHDHSQQSESTLRMFVPAIISFTLLLIAIGFDNYFPQTWFTGWVRIGWYVVAYFQWVFQL